MRCVLTACLALCLTLTAQAGPHDLEVGTGDTLDGLLMGTLEYGAQVGVDDLRGKVVMFALWGT